MHKDYTHQWEQSLQKQDFSIFPERDSIYDEWATFTKTDD